MFVKDTLTQNTEDLKKDRDPLSWALDQTEAEMIGSRDTANQQDQVNLSAVWLFICSQEI